MFQKTTAQPSLDRAPHDKAVAEMPLTDDIY
jgi:hypothetical protein